MPGDMTPKVKEETAVASNNPEKIDRGSLLIKAHLVTWSVDLFHIL